MDETGLKHVNKIDLKIIYICKTDNSICLVSPANKCTTLNETGIWEIELLNEIKLFILLQKYIN